LLIISLSGPGGHLFRFLTAFPLRRSHCNHSLLRHNWQFFRAIARIQGLLTASILKRQSASLPIIVDKKFSPPCRVCRTR